MDIVLYKILHNLNNLAAKILSNDSNKEEFLVYPMKKIIESENINLLGIPYIYKVKAENFGDAQDIVKNICKKGALFPVAKNDQYNYLELAKDIMMNYFVEIISNRPKNVDLYLPLPPNNSYVNIDKIIKDDKNYSKIIEILKKYPIKEI